MGKDESAATPAPARPGSRNGAPSGSVFVGRGDGGAGPEANGDGGLGAARALGELDELRADVLAYVRTSYRSSLNEHDCEDLAQAACVAVIDRMRAGERIADVHAFMKQVAWRRARDLVRARRATPVDPTGLVLERAARDDISLDQRLGDRARFARALEAVEQLSEEERAAYRARFVEQLSGAEACRRLGIRRSAYYKRLRAATEHVGGAISGGSARFAQLEREILGEYVAGIAKGRARRRAARLIALDPDAAAMARELRRVHEAAAASLPPVAIDQATDVGALERLAALGVKAREAVGGALGRGSEASDAVSPLVAGGGTRGAGAAGAGVLAKLAGVGLAGKAAIGCVAAGGAASACVAAGVLPTPLASDAGAERTQPAPQVREVAPSPPLSAAELLPSQVGHEPPPPEPTPQPEPPATPEPDPEPAPETVDPVAPTAPLEQQEFGVAPAAAPVENTSGGSGGSSGDGAGSSSPVQQEFGP